MERCPAIGRLTIYERVGVPRADVDYVLRELEILGIVSKKTVGKYDYYRLVGDVEGRVKTLPDRKKLRGKRDERATLNTG